MLFALDLFRNVIHVCLFFFDIAYFLYDRNYYYYMRHSCFALQALLILHCLVCIKGSNSIFFTGALWLLCFVCLLIIGNRDVTHVCIVFLHVTDYVDRISEI